MNICRILAAVTVLIELSASAIAQSNSSQNPQEQASASVASVNASPIVPGTPLHKVIPKYPKEARKAKLEGEVEVRATVEPSGDVNGVLIISGNPKLAAEAADAVRTWKFGPYSQSGKPVWVVQNIRFSFAHGKKEAELEPLPPATLADVVTQTSASAGVFRVGGGVSAPKVIFSPDPEYSEEAREEKYQGSCVLGMIVTPEGKPRDIHIVRTLGKGLDEKAIEAVRQWKFEPAMRDGKPVAVLINVVVTFRLR